MRVLRAFLLVVPCVSLLAGCATTTTESSAPVSSAATSRPWHATIDWGEYTVLDSVHTPPIPDSIPETPYPAELFARGISGQAVATFVVMPDGSCTHLKVRRASKSSFARVVKETMRHARFKPAHYRGALVACHVRMTFYFTIVHPPPPKPRPAPAPS